MEVLVSNVRGLPGESVVSIRAGHTRRQAPISAISTEEPEGSRPLRFPETPGTCAHLKIDVLAPLSSQRIVVHPQRERYTVDLDCGRSFLLQLKGLRQGADANGAQEACKSQQESSALATAQEYLDSFHVLQYMQNLVQGLAQNRPANPFEFMWTQLGSLLQKGPERARADEPGPRGDEAAAHDAALAGSERRAARAQEEAAQLSQQVELLKGEVERHQGQLASQREEVERHREQLASQREAAECAASAAGEAERLRQEELGACRSRAEEMEREVQRMTEVHLQGEDALRSEAERFRQDAERQRARADDAIRRVEELGEQLQRSQAERASASLAGAERRETRQPAAQRRLGAETAAGQPISPEAKARCRQLLEQQLESGELEAVLAADLDRPAADAAAGAKARFRGLLVDRLEASGLEALSAALAPAQAAQEASLVASASLGELDAAHAASANYAVAGDAELRALRAEVEALKSEAERFRLEAEKQSARADAAARNAAGWRDTAAAQQQQRVAQEGALPTGDDAGRGPAAGAAGACGGAEPPGLKAHFRQLLEHRLQSGELHATLAAGQVGAEPAAGRAGVGEPPAAEARANLTGAAPAAPPCAQPAFKASVRGLLEQGLQAGELEKVLDAEAEAKKEAEEKANQEAEAKAKKEAEENAKGEAEARAKKEAEEHAKKEAEAKAKREAEEKANQEAEAKAKKEAEENAKKEAEAKAKKEAEEHANREAEARAKKEAEEKAPTTYTVQVLAAKNLHDRDGVGLGDSDPFCQLYMNDKNLGKTDTIKNNLNPDWTTSANFSFEVQGVEGSTVTFKVWDDDTMVGKSGSGKKESLGTCELPLPAPGATIDKWIVLTGTDKEVGKGGPTLHVKVTSTPETPPTSAAGAAGTVAEAAADPGKTETKPLADANLPGAKNGAAPSPGAKATGALAAAEPSKTETKPAAGASPTGTKSGAAARHGAGEANQEAEANAKKAAEENAKKEAEAKAKKEAEEHAKKEAEAKAKKEAEDNAKREAEAKAKKEAEAKAKREAEEQANKEAEAKAKKETEEHATAAAGPGMRGARALSSSRSSSKDEPAGCGGASPLPGPRGEPARAASPRQGKPAGPGAAADGAADANKAVATPAADARASPVTPRRRLLSSGSPYPATASVLSPAQLRPPTVLSPASVAVVDRGSARRRSPVPPPLSHQQASDLLREFEEAKNENEDLQRTFERCKEQMEMMERSAAQRRGRRTVPSSPDPGRPPAAPASAVAGPAGR